MKLDSLPFVPARDFKKGRPGGINFIVIHDAECAETRSAAEDLGEYGRHPDYTSSWHISVDVDSAERSVRDEDTAYAAPPVNPEALHIELAGRGAQSRSQWMDPYSLATIDNAAQLVAQWCLKHDIPCRQLTNDQLSRKEKGIVGHYQVSAVWKRSDHTDPGTGFPWDIFLEKCKTYVAAH